MEARYLEEKALEIPEDELDEVNGLIILVEIYFVIYLYYCNYFNILLLHSFLSSI